MALVGRRRGTWKKKRWFSMEPHSPFSAASWTSRPPPRRHHIVQLRTMSTARNSRIWTLRDARRWRNPSRCLCYAEDVDCGLQTWRCRSERRAFVNSESSHLKERRWGIEAAKNCVLVVCFDEENQIPTLMEELFTEPQIFVNEEVGIGLLKRRRRLWWREGRERMWDAERKLGFKF